MSDAEQPSRKPGDTSSRQTANAQEAKPATLSAAAPKGAASATTAGAGRSTQQGAASSTTASAQAAAGPDDRKPSAGPTQAAAGASANERAGNGNAQGTTADRTRARQEVGTKNSADAVPQGLRMSMAKPVTPVQPSSTSGRVTLTGAGNAAVPAQGDIPRAKTSGEQKDVNRLVDRPDPIPLRIRATGLLGLAVMLLLVGGMGVWAATTQIDSAVIAQGAVKAGGKNRTVQHLEGGVVSALRVSDGDKVEKDEVLIVLDETLPKANFEILDAQFKSLKSIEARWVAEQALADNVTFPQVLLDQADEPKVAELIAAQRQLFKVRQQARENERLLLEEQINQLDQTIEGLTAQRQSRQAQIDLIDEELGDMRKLLERGLIARPRVLAMERERANHQGEYGRVVSAIAEARGKISEIRLQILQTEEQRRETIVTELGKVRDELANVENRVNAARSVLNDLEITAPVAGTVVNLEQLNEGSVIKPGQGILEIVPQDRMVIEVDVMPFDIDGLKVGQPAEVRLLPFNQRAVPSLYGEFAYRSADVVINEQQRIPVYKARIEVPEEEFQAKLGGRVVVPGMPAEVIIKTGERTAMDYLVQPIVESANRAWRED